MNKMYYRVFNRLSGTLGNIFEDVIVKTGNIDSGFFSLIDGELIGGMEPLSNCIDWKYINSCI